MKDLKIQKFYRMDGLDVYIDIKIHYYREVFNTWDFSPLLNRDLDDDLFEYLEECAREIPRRNRIHLAFHLPGEIRASTKEEVHILSLRNFFDYKIRKLQIEKRTIYLNTMKYSLFGILFISLGFFLQDRLPRYALLEILKEGFFIGGWVLFWELFTTIFFTKDSLHKTMTALKRLKEAPVEYVYS